MKPSPVFAQIKDIYFDLSNEYINRIYSDSTEPSRDVYRQNYLFKTNGYLFHPNLLTFNLKSDLYILSDSQVTPSLKKLQDARSFGYYDFTIMLLPKQNTNIKIFSLQNKTNRNDKIWDKSKSLLPSKTFSEITINRTGLTITRSSNKNLPGITFTASRLSAKDYSKISWLRNILDLKVFNNNPKENASYSLTFRAYDQKKITGNINDMKYDINLLTNAKLSNKSKITVRGNIIKYSLTESIIGDLRHYYTGSKMLYNDFTIRVNQYKYNSGENLSYRIQNRLRLDKNQNYKLRLTTNYNSRIIKTVSNSTQTESGYIKPELIFNQRNRLLQWNGILQYNLGIVENEGTVGFTHNTIGNIRLSTLKYRILRIALTEGFGYSTFLNNSKILRNKSGIEILLNLNYRLNAGGYITWENLKYISLGDSGYSRVLFRGIVNSQPTNTMRIKFENQYSYNYSNSANNISRSRLTISESGIIKNAVFYVAAERIIMDNNNYRRSLLWSFQYPGCTRH